MSKRDSLLLFLVLVGVLSVLGFHPLADPDLPWHLVGGLWIAEHSAVPRLDPLGAPGAAWIAYSWLPEVLIAAVYQLDGFSGLRLLQLSFVLFAGFSVFVLFCRVCRRDEDLLAALIAWLFSLSLLAPMFHLRPQLLSVGFFALFLRLLLSKRTSLLWLFLLTVFWANVHVFWVFVPTITMVHFALRRDFRKALLSALLLSGAGVLSPYGFENISLVFHYAFSHGIAYQLIDEFRPLSPKLGYLFPLFLCSLLLLPVFFRKIQNDPERQLLFLLAIVFGTASLFQRKYLPFSGVVSGTLLTILLIPFVTKLRGGEESEREEEKRSTGESTRTKVLLGFTIFLFLGTLFFFRDTDPALLPEKEELLRLAELIPTPLAGAVSVFEGFDEGGWVGLAFFLQDGAKKRKTLIDGRTLVMGEERLAAYARMVQGLMPPCQLLEQWKADFAIVDRSSRVREELLQGKNLCQQSWALLTESPHWSVLQAHRPTGSTGVQDFPPVSQ